MAERTWTQDEIIEEARDYIRESGLTAISYVRLNDPQRAHDLLLEALYETRAWRERLDEAIYRGEEVSLTPPPTSTDRVFKR